VELDGKEQLIAGKLMNLVDGQELQLSSKGAD